LASQRDGRPGYFTVRESTVDGARDVWIDARDAWS
jgi:hypothetical protein